MTCSPPIQGSPQIQVVGFTHFNFLSRVYLFSTSADGGLAGVRSNRGVVGLANGVRGASELRIL